MNTPIPPVIPNNSQLQSLRVNDLLLANTASITTVGAFTIIEGLDVTYTPADICNGVIVRENLTSGSTDILPSPQEIAEYLNLSTNNTYVKTFTIYNNDSNTMGFDLGDWTYYGLNSIGQYFSAIFIIELKYQNGEWIGSLLRAAGISND